MYKVNLPEFEGPLDLLLHLIKKDDVDIFSININKITQQYLDYINYMDTLNLDIASEYLVMAAELMEIKANNLLPKKETIEDEYEEDPKEQLIKKLIEYKQYKEMTTTFKNLETYRQEVYTRNTDEIVKYKDNDNNQSNYGFNIDDLVQAFNNFLKRKELDKPLNTTIAKKDYSIHKRCQEIKNLIKLKKKVSFNELFDIIDKDYIVVTFLSILSLTKNGDIIIKQDYNFQNITMEAN
ncbi:MAG: segregation/condensation protein A [Bacilli bacterium]|nr:segregation/condensation protein A [Bacilli bacterium]